MLASSRSAGLDAIGIPEQMRGEHLRPGVRRTWPADDRVRRRPGLEARSRPPERPATTGGETTFPLPIGSERIGNTAQMLRKETKPVDERRLPIEDWLVAVDLPGPCRTDVGSRRTACKRVQRFSAVSCPSRMGGRSRVIHRVDPPLPCPQSTNEIFDAVARRLPPYAQRPAHSEILVSQGPFARLPPRPPDDVRWSEYGIIGWHVALTQLCRTTGRMAMRWGREGEPT